MNYSNCGRANSHDDNWSEEHKLCLNTPVCSIYIFLWYTNFKSTWCYYLGNKEKSERKKGNDESFSLSSSAKIYV